MTLFTFLKNTRVFSSGTLRGKTIEDKVLKGSRNFYIIKLLVETTQQASKNHSYGNVRYVNETGQKAV